MNELETRLSIMEREKAHVETSPAAQRMSASPGPGGWLKYVAMGSGALAIMGLIILAGPAVVERISGAGGGRIMTYSIPSENVTAISATDKYVWLCDWVKQEIYKMEPDKDSRSIPPRGGMESSPAPGRDELVTKNTYVLSVMPAGIAETKDFLWTCDTWARKINKHVYDDKLSVIAGFPSPGVSPSALCYDGKALWSCDGETKKIYRHDIKDPFLPVTATFNSPCERQIGLFYDGSYYWSVDGEKQMAYKQDKDMQVIKSYSMSIAGKKMSGVLITKKHIWIAFEGENRIVRYPRSALLN